MSTKWLLANALRKRPTQRSFKEMSYSWEEVALAILLRAFYCGLTNQ